METCATLAQSHTYLHELSAGPHKLSEAQQEILFIWENLCQLDKEEEEELIW